MAEANDNSFIFESIRLNKVSNFILHFDCLNKFFKKSNSITLIYGWSFFIPNKIEFTSYSENSLAQL